MLLIGGGSFFSMLVFTVNLIYQVQVAHLNPLQLVLVGTVLEGTSFLFEVPTGIVADVYSRRLSIIIGTFLLGVGLALQGVVPSFGVILLAQVIWGIGYTFTSGATEAWLTDEIGVDPREPALPARLADRTDRLDCRGRHRHRDRQLLAPTPDPDRRRALSRHGRRAPLHHAGARLHADPARGADDVAGDGRATQGRRIARSAARMCC